MVDFFKFLHIVLAFIFFSGTMVNTVLMMQAAKEPNIQAVAPIAKMAGQVAIFMVYLPFILLGVFGVLTAQQMHIPLTGTGWLEAAYVSSIVGFLVGFFVMGGHGRATKPLVIAAMKAGKKTPELQAHLDSKKPMIVGTLLDALIIWIIVLMVFKPF